MIQKCLFPSQSFHMQTNGLGLRNVAFQEFKEESGARNGDKLW